MIVCYLILKPILQITENNAIEKKNFYDVYSLLAIETVLTIRILKRNKYRIQGVNLKINFIFF
jgi:hypothetical protein